MTYYYTYIKNIYFFSKFYLKTLQFKRYILYLTYTIFKIKLYTIILLIVLNVLK